MMPTIIQLFVQGLTMGSIYSLVGLGFHIIYNGTRIINFAQGEQVILGGVIALSCVTALELPLVFGFLLTIIIASMVSLFYERIVIRPILRRSELATIISSIAVAIILQNAIAVIWGKDPLFFPPFTKGEPIKCLDAYINLQSIWIIGVTFISFSGFEFLLNYTTLGKAIRASANNPEAARLVGISSFKMVSYSFIFSGGLASIAGVIIAPITFAGGPIGTMIAIKGFIGGILGGISSSRSVFLGCIMLGILEFFIAGFISDGYRDAIAVFIFLIALLLKPEGLFIRGQG